MRDGLDWLDLASFLWALRFRLVHGLLGLWHIPHHLILRYFKAVPLRVIVVYASFFRTIHSFFETSLF